LSNPKNLTLHYTKELTFLVYLQT